MTSIEANVKFLASMTNGKVCLPPGQVVRPVQSANWLRAASGSHLNTTSLKGKLQLATGKRGRAHQSLTRLSVVQEGRVPPAKLPGTTEVSALCNLVACFSNRTCTLRCRNRANGWRYCLQSFPIPADKLIELAQKVLLEDEVRCT